ncbi:MAG: hypothetical protein U0132_20685 [Gemmatimonadaceae bacterium]
MSSNAEKTVEQSPMTGAEFVPALELSAACEGISSATKHVSSSVVEDE